MRYFFEITYHGKNYNGWQSQNNAVGVQSVVEDAMSKLLQQEIGIVASGRTDTGVHCAQQFFHADIDGDFNAPQLIQKLNSFLPKDIAIRSVQAVRETASARYDATQRSYRYHITRAKNPLMDGLAWHYFKSLDVQTMNQAAALLPGERDFECFSKVNTDVNHFLCDMKRAVWTEDGDMLYFDITANRFLRGMVRAIVGTLLDVGAGKISTADFQSIILSKDRRKAGANVPPHGLYLMSVQYPSSIFLNKTN